jgi:4-amino-4-deoxy-L-arabinose transferase-like glycosyltransferase
MSTQANTIPAGKAVPMTGGRHPLLRAAKQRVEQLSQVQERVFLFFIFVVALAIRLAALLSMRQVSALPGRQAGADGIEFEQLARALAEGRGYVRLNGAPTAFRAPGFPMFVSIIYRLTNISVSAATLSFPLVGAGVCVVTYLLAREVVSERVARLAALLGVVYFPAIYFSTVWFSEPLFMLSFGLSLWLFLIYLRRQSYASEAASYRTLAVAGLLFSFSMLIRPFAILMLPALLILDFINSRRRALTMALLLVCTMAPISLWGVRNYHLFHAFVMGTTNGGSTFYGGNNDTVLRVPEHMGGWVSTVRLPGRAEIVAAPNEYLHDQVEWRLGKEWVKTHLASMPLLLTMKIARFILPDIDTPNKTFAVLSFVTTFPFLLLGIIGIRKAAYRKSYTMPWLVIHLGVAMSVLTGLAFWGSPRFRDAVAPLLLIYAAVGLNSLLGLDFCSFDSTESY